jgi:hypothetical protein
MHLTLLFLTQTHHERFLALDLSRTTFPFLWVQTTSTLSQQDVRYPILTLNQCSNSTLTRLHQDRELDNNFLSDIEVLSKRCVVDAE